MSVSVIMAIHNEERYLPRSLPPLVKADINEFVAILDRCIDNSEEIVKQHFPKAKLIRKEQPKWMNSYAENLQLGYEASKGSVVCIHDADIESPPQLLTALMRHLEGTVASVSPMIRTDKKTSVLNLLYHYWEKTYELAPLGREPRGGVRLIKRKYLEEVGGFRDVAAPDTRLDLDLSRSGHESKLIEEVVSLHLREFSFRKAIRSQILSGRTRRQHRAPLWRVLGHSIIRLRPFVLYGYFREKV